MAIYHAAFDESGKADREAIVFAGLIAPPVPWANFNKEWLKALEPFGLRYWRTTDAAQLSREFKRFRDRRNELHKLTPDLADIICRFADGGTAHTITIDMYEQLPEEQRRELKDPFYAAFQTGLVNLATGPHLTTTDTVTLVYDDAEEYARECLDSYRRLKKLRPDIGDRIIGLCFNDDKMYPPLQGADLFAFVYRRKAEGILNGVWLEVMEKFNATFSDETHSDITL